MSRLARKIFSIKPHQVKSYIENNRSKLIGCLKSNDPHDLKTILEEVKEGFKTVKLTNNPTTSSDDSVFEKSQFV